MKFLTMKTYRNKYIFSPSSKERHHHCHYLLFSQIYFNRALLEKFLLLFFFCIGQKNSKLSRVVKAFVNRAEMAPFTNNSDGNGNFPKGSLLIYLLHDEKIKRIFFETLNMTNIPIPWDSIRDHLQPLDDGYLPIFPANFADHVYQS